MASDQDTISAITVLEYGMEEESIKRRVEQTSGDRAVDIVILRPQPNMTTRNCIKEYLVGQKQDNRYIDFMCLGRFGRSREASG